MPANPLSRVHEGDDLVETALSAARHNAYSAAAQKVLGGWPRPDPKPGRPPVPSVEVSVRNDTGKDLDAFSVVVVRADVQIIDPLTYPFAAQDDPLYAATLPSSPTDRPAVLSEPLPAGQIGRAVVAGHTLCRIQSIGGYYGADHARPIAGETAMLRQAAGGPVRLLTPGNLTGGVQLLPVVIDDDSIDGWVRAAPFTDFTDAILLGTEDVVTLTEPGFYLLFAAVAAGIRPRGNAGLPNVDFTTTVYAGWQAAAPHRWRAVAQTIHFRADKANFQNWWYIPVGSGSAPLQHWLRLTPAMVPFVVRVVWGARTDTFSTAAGGIIDPGGGGGSAGTFVENFYYLNRQVMEFSAIRLPGIATGSAVDCTTPYWGLIPVSQPSPPACAKAEAFDDAYTVPAGGVLKVPPSGVLANDTVPAGYSAVLDSLPTYGTLTFNADGSFTYNQNVQLTGHTSPLLDTFTYHLADAFGNASPPATVTITITQGGGGGVGQFAPLGAGGTVVGMSGVAPGSGSTGPSSGGGSG